MDFEIFMQKAKYKCRALWFPPQCDINWAVIYFFQIVKMGQMDAELNRIPMTWSGAGVWREEEERKGKAGEGAASSWGEKRERKREERKLLRVFA